MKIRPLHDQVVIRRDNEEIKTQGGIILASREKKNQGEVVAVGKGYINDVGDVRPLDVKVGDEVLFSIRGLSVTTIVIDGDELLMMRESDILGVLEA